MKKEVEQIRAQYTGKTVSKMDELKALDRKVKLPAEIFGYSFGIAGSLVLGTGMCLAMGVIGSSMPLGIVIGVLGIGLVTANYFLYKAILNSRKKKYAEQVLALSDSILHEEEN